MSKELDALKKFRAPFWSRILGWYRARQILKQKLKERHLIAIVRQWTYWSDAKHWDSQSYYCYRRGDGLRSYECVNTNTWLNSREKTSYIYNFVVKAWIDGGGGGVTDGTLRDFHNSTIRCPEKIPQA